MSIEQALATLTAAVEANTAALLKAGGAPAAAPAAADAEAPKRGRPAKTETTPPAKTTKPAHDRNAVNAALEELKEAHGVQAAKDIITKIGKAAKRADIPEENLTAVYEACKAKMEEADGGDSDDDM